MIARVSVEKKACGSVKAESSRGIYRLYSFIREFTTRWFRDARTAHVSTSVCVCLCVCLCVFERVLHHVRAASIGGGEKTREVEERAADEEIIEE